METTWGTLSQAGPADPGRIDWTIARQLTDEAVARADAVADALMGTDPWYSQVGGHTDSDMSDAAVLARLDAAEQRLDGSAVPVPMSRDAMIENLARATELLDCIRAETRTNAARLRETPAQRRDPHDVTMVELIVRRAGHLEQKIGRLAREVAEHDFGTT